MDAVNIFWFRRDLRLADNTGLYHALRGNLPVIPIFIFDRNILDKLEEKSDRRVEFIHAALQDMEKELLSSGAAMEVYYGSPREVFTTLLDKYKITAVYCNHDYEPYAIERDSMVESLLKNAGVMFRTSKDQVIFEKNEVVKDDGKPYTVFTPYSRKWKVAFQHVQQTIFPSEKYIAGFYKQTAGKIPSLQQIGFLKSNQEFPSKEIPADLLKNYGKERDFPALPATSKLGVHVRFGTISIRQLASRTKELSETFLNELIWRDFYQMILWHFPRVGNGMAFKPVYDTIEWRHDTGEFEKWCNGLTGYPIVDAGMRELNATGFMHNRVRMITASFLAKHLLLDWRLGEAYFAKKLLDFDLASNNGGWQWAAGSGCDAAPYFRIFNPYLQTKKFDPQLVYINKWVPELNEMHYPKPIVNHEFARKRCLETYARALKKNS